ncbi:hypothetical protein MD484_g8878, partial [Candolleomyces efflorescens]
MPALPNLPFLSIPPKPRGWILGNKAEDPALGPVNLFKPYDGVPGQIVYNMKTPGRVSYANSTSKSWAYDEVLEPISEAHDESLKAYADQVLEKPAWYTHFHIAVRSDQDKDYHSRAEKIVQSAPKWSLSDLSLLVHLFIARAAVCDEEDSLLAVASFVHHVAYGFQEKMPSYFNKFVAQLERVLTGTFLACWDQKYERSLARVPYVEHQTEDYLASSLNLAKFMGALVENGVLNQANIKPCVRLLIHQATHTEYLKAIRYILLFAQQEFWTTGSDDDVAGFLRALDEVASPAEESKVSVQAQELHDDEGDDTSMVTSLSSESGSMEPVTVTEIYKDIVDLVDCYSQAASS